MLNLSFFDDIPDKLVEPVELVLATELVLVEEGNPHHYRDDAIKNTAVLLIQGTKKRQT